MSAFLKRRSLHLRRYLATNFDGAIVVRRVTVEVTGKASWNAGTWHPNPRKKQHHLLSFMSHIAMNGWWQEYESCIEGKDFENCNDRSVVVLPVAFLTLALVVKVDVL